MSLDTVELLVAIENKFNIQISNREAESIFTVGDFHKVVWKHISKAEWLQNNSQSLIKEYSRQEMELAINEIIAKCAGLDLPEIKPEKSIANDLGLD